MNKKGITPIIAIVLLLMITVAVAGSVNYWLSSVQKSTQTGVEESTEAIAASGQYMIDVRYKKCETVESGTWDMITVQLLNIGTRSIKGGTVAITVRDEDSNDIAYIENNTVSDFSGTEYLEKDASLRIEWDISDTEYDLIWGVDTRYELLITLPGAITASTTCTTPKSGST